MQCATCHSEVPGSSRFCNNCGAPVALDAMPTMTGGSPGTETPTPSSRSSVEGRFPVGTVLVERYRILRMLGRGGMGEVYHAHDSKLDQEVALKFLSEFAQDPSHLERFRAEVRIARQISHPNVCRVYDMGEADQTPFISMEYVDGEDLRSLLRRIGRLPPDKATEIARRLCAGIAAAHEVGVLHRDLKPANIMIDGQGRVHIMDFGLAHLAGDVEDVRSGTPAYMAPEQADGREVTVRSDIYALGLVLFETFTGRKAFPESGARDTPPSASSIVSDLDPSVEQVIHRCLDPNPARRPASALDVARALPGGDPLGEALAAGETPSPEMVAASEDTGALSVRAAAACVGIIVAGLVTVFLMSGKTEGLNILPPPLSPDVLAQASRELATELGYPDPPADRAYRFVLTGWQSMNDWAGRTLDPAAYREMLASGGLAPLVFTHRESPGPLVMQNPRGFVFDEDPPFERPGMVRLTLSPQGRLLTLGAIPVTGSGPGAGDWEATLFDAAGLDREACALDEEPWTPNRMSDENRVWTCPYPEGPTVRVETAALEGQATWFAVRFPWEPAVTGVLPAQRPSLGEQLATLIGVFLTFGVVLFAGFLARRNYRRGSGDLPGALRLGVFAFAAEMIYWVTFTHYLPIGNEMLKLSWALAEAMYYGVILALLYVAIEPYVRRRWPQPLISWTRLLGGSWRDPLVGSHMLVGLAVGFVPALFGQFGRALAFPVLPPISVPPVDLAKPIGALMFYLVRIVLQAWGGFFVFFLARILLRRNWMVILLISALGVAPQALQGASPTLIVVSLLFYLIGIGVVLRFGLLPLIAAVFVTQLSAQFTITPELSAWYGHESVYLLVAILGLTAWAFHAALGGRSLFGEGFLES